MKRLGKVLHISKARKLILSTEINLKLGTQVYDSKLIPVGSVADIFGPVKKPYMSIKPVIDTPERYIGQNLYVM